MLLIALIGGDYLIAFISAVIKAFLNYSYYSSANNGITRLIIGIDRLIDSLGGQGVGRGGGPGDRAGPPP